MTSADEQAERIPVDDGYLRALGRAAYNFAYLEWSIIWLTEPMRKGFLRQASQPTAGKIADEFPCEVERLDDTAPDRIQLLSLANDFRKIVKIATASCTEIPIQQGSVNSACCTTAGMVAGTGQSMPWSNSPPVQQPPVLRQGNCSMAVALNGARPLIPGTKIVQMARQTSRSDRVRCRLSARGQAAGGIAGRVSAPSAGCPSPPPGPACG